MNIDDNAVSIYKHSWIGVDLDGTLAYYDEWRGIEHIGDPIPIMLERMKSWINQGITVKIVTARVSEQFVDKVKAAKYIQDYTEKHLGVRLEVTNKKDFGMRELWDDRAIQVIFNTGLRADNKVGP